MRCHLLANRKSLLCGIGITWFAFGAWTVSAQAQADHELTSLSIEELTRVKVFSVSRHLEDSRKAPSAVSVITADEIARYGWRTMADALRSLRGFYTAYDRNYTYLGIRGFLRPGDYNSRILLMVNGHRMNDDVYGTAAVGTEFPLDIDLIDHIEVVRGPSSSLYGSNAVFGVINVITRRPGPGLSLEASGNLSSFKTRAGRVTATLQKGALSVLFSGSMYRSPGQARLFFPEFATPETNGGIAQNVDGDRYAHGFADAQYGNWRVQALFGSRLKVVPTASYATNFNDPGTRTTDTRGYVDLSYHRSFSSGTDLDVRTYVDNYKYYATYAYGGTNSPDRYLNLDTANSIWAGTEVTVGRQIGNHRITGGAQYEYAFSADQRNLDVGGQTYVNDRRTPSMAAAYGEAELKLLPQVTVRAGGRVDHFDAHGTSLSPRLAVIYSPNARTGVKYIFGRAFRTPNAYESYYSDSMVAEANPGLGSENIRSHELVLERSFRPWLQTTGEVYYSRLRNAIGQELDPATGWVHYMNSGRDRSRGLELELEAKRASGLATRASYTLSDTRDEIAQTTLINAPVHMAKLNVTAPVLSRAFAGLELLYSGTQTSYQGTRVPCSFVTNITASTKPIWGGLEFSAGLYNSFDHREFSPAGNEHTQAVIPQNGRTYQVKATYRLPLQEARHAQ